jgi:hypothetical protein
VIDPQPTTRAGLYCGFVAPHRTLLVVLVVLAAAALGAVLLWRAQRPRADRDWADDQKILPSVEIDGETVTVRHVRNFRYRSETDYTPGYYDLTFRLPELATLDYVVEPFGRLRVAAHTFLTFGIDGGRHLAISVEIRKRKGQDFSASKSAFPYYELMYVAADERDVVALRTNYRKDQVFIYPVKADRAAVRAIFLDYAERLNQIHERPEFYNLFHDSCITNILDSVDRATGRHISWSYQVLLPAYSDAYALKLGLLDTDLPLAAAREKFNINERAERFADDPNFSTLIRAPSP